MIILPRLEFTVISTCVFLGSNYSTWHVLRCIARNNVFAESFRKLHVGFSVADERSVTKLSLMPVSIILARCADHFGSAKVSFVGRGNCCQVSGKWLAFNDEGRSPGQTTKKTFERWLCVKPQP